MAEAGFSLLMAVYAGDRPEYLERAFVSSVQEQSRRPDEVVLVQDGPVSAELEAVIGRLVAESPVPVVHVVLEQNAGLARALERGLAACSFDVVARMDADDVSLPERFERQLALIGEGFDLVGAGIVEFVDESSPLGVRVPPTGAENIARTARFRSPFNHPTVVFRRQAVLDAGGYVDIGPMEDYWLFGRMIFGGARVENLEESLLMYRVGDGAYARRGGLRQLRAELRLQREFRRLGFTSFGQFTRNVLVRGGYRLVPEGIRRFAYRKLIVRGSNS